MPVKILMPRNYQISRTKICHDKLLEDSFWDWDCLDIYLKIYLNF